MMEINQLSEKLAPKWGMPSTITESKLEEFLTSSGRRGTLGAAAGDIKGFKRQPQIKTLKDVRNLGLLMGSAQQQMLTRLTSRGFLGWAVPGMSGIRFLRKISSPEKMAAWRQSVNVMNAKMAGIEETLTKDVATGFRTKSTFQGAIVRKAKFVDEVIPEGEELVSRKIRMKWKSTFDIRGGRLSANKIIGRAGLVHLSRFMKGMYIWGGLKKVGGTVITNALNTAKSVTSIARQMGRMEFGSGKTLDTRMASTERSRAIMAMQNAGLSARSYLGQEASIMSKG